MNKNSLQFTMEDFGDNTGFLILKVSNLWKNYYGYVLKKCHNLSHIQYTVLASINQLSLQNSKTTQVMLAKHLNIDPMNLSYILKGLEVSGYICRIPHPVDVRAKIVNLTQEGKELLLRAINTIAKADLKFFKILGKNPERFNRDLLKLLQANN